MPPNTSEEIDDLRATGLHMLNNSSSIADFSKNTQKYFEPYIKNFNQQIMEDRNIGLGPQLQPLSSIV